MPHMMPMLWMLIFLTSFLFLLLLSSLMFFFHIPKIKKNPMSKISPDLMNKWTWLW